MGYKRFGGALAASVFTISAVVAPAFIAETNVQAATKVKLNKTECELTVGGTAKLKLKGGKAVKFETSDKKIATVNKSGKVKAKKAGTVTISVYDENGKVYKCKVTVTKKKSNTVINTDNIDLGGMEIIIRDWWHPAIDSDYVESPRNDYEEYREEYRKEMMKKYNFTIKEVGISDWGNALYDFNDYVKNGGDKNNYVFALHFDDQIYDELKTGYFYDVGQLDCLDFSEEKFMRNLSNEKFKINDSVYAFYAGDADPLTGVFFNKQVLRNAGIDPDTIYDAQKNGTWTWDMFEKLMDQCHRDTDGDGDIDVYGLTLNEGIMINAAVTSNNGSFIGKKTVSNKKTEYTYGLESAETLEALKWCVDMFNKFDNHDPVDASWDYYREEWLDGKAAFMVDQDYLAVNGGTLSNTDFDMGFVTFPKGPKAKDYKLEYSSNTYAIPACYDSERAWKIAFAWNLYTNPVPGYEDYREATEQYKAGNFDRRTIEETLPILCDPKHGTVSYNNFLTGISVNMDLVWNIQPGVDVSDIIVSIGDRWKDAVKKTNKKK